MAVQTIRNRTPATAKSIITVRLDPALHDWLKDVADRTGRSLNLLCVEALERECEPATTQNNNPA